MGVTQPGLECQPRTPSTLRMNGTISFLSSMPSWRGEETLYSFYFLSSKTTCSSLRMIGNLYYWKALFILLFLIPAEKRKTCLVLIIAYRTSGVVLCYLCLESVLLQAWLFFTRYSHEHSSTLLILPITDLLLQHASASNSTELTCLYHCTNSTL